jgi:hypothetical protein
VVVDLDDLDQSRLQVASLLQPILQNIIRYRGISRDSTLNDFEVAAYDSCSVVDKYNEVIHERFAGKRLYIRAYHGTRHQTPTIFYQQGLRQLDIDRLNQEVIEHAQDFIGKPIPLEMISKWTQTDFYKRLGQIRNTSKGPHFLLGSFYADDCIGGIGRFCLEGSEMARDLARRLGDFLKKHDFSPTISGAKLQASFFSHTIGVLVVCDLPYDSLNSTAQNVIRQELLAAVMFENTRGRVWEGGGSLCLNQDVLGDWVVGVHEATFVDGRIDFPTFNKKERH